MTDATMPEVDELSRRIAEQGRVALVERLRTAYRDAASAHADIVTLEEDRIEALVQSAADHADGLQWRRALAGLAAQELGVSVAEALSHPAVVQAQSIVGAPSYEQSLAELISRPIPLPLAPLSDGYEDPESSAPEPIEGEVQTEEGDGAAEATTTMSDASHSPELETAMADDEVIDLLPSPDPSLELATEQYELPAEDPEAPEAEVLPAEPEAPEAELSPADPETQDSVSEPLADVAPEPSLDAPHAPAEVPPAAEDEVGELRVTAIHLGGVANLPTGGDGFDLRMSEHGLDIMRSNDDIIGRLPWSEIEALEVPSQRKRRRQSNVTAKLVVRTRQGDASFEIPGVSSEELRARVELRLERYRQL